jgi:hypothetical protein
MAKNLTLSIPDELAEKIAGFPEVNWSAVARRCIEQYVEARLMPDMSKLLEKLQEERGQEYVRGRKFAATIAEELGYRSLNEVVREYWKEREKQEEFEESGGPPPGENYETPNESMEKVLSKKYSDVEGASEAFLQGVREALIEIGRLLEK